MPLDDPAASPAAPLTDNWSAAVERFAASDFIRDTFGERYQSIYTNVRRDEISQLTTEISQVEYRTYLGRL